jgi:hypothetical protein
MPGARRGRRALRGVCPRLPEVRALGFPVFACGTVPYDMDGRLEVVGHGEPVEIDGVLVEPGALVLDVFQPVREDYLDRWNSLP